MIIVFVCGLLCIGLIKDFLIFNRMKKSFKNKFSEISSFEKSLLLEKQRIEATLQEAKAEARNIHAVATEAYKKIEFMAIELEQQGKETYASLSQLWDEMKTQLTVSQGESVDRLHALMKKMEKLCLEAEHHVVQLIEKTEDSKRIFQVLKGADPIETILQEISEEKYSKAKLMVQRGHSVVEAAKATGLSVSEVSLAAQS